MEPRATTHAIISGSARLIWIVSRRDFPSGNRVHFVVWRLMNLALFDFDGTITTNNTWPGDKAGSRLRLRVFARGPACGRSLISATPWRRSTTGSIGPFSFQATAYLGGGEHCGNLQGRCTTRSALETCRLPCLLTSPGLGSHAANANKNCVPAFDQLGPRGRRDS